MTVRTTCTMALRRYAEAEGHAATLGKASSEFVEFAAHVLHRLAVIHPEAGDAKNAQRLIACDP